MHHFSCAGPVQLVLLLIIVTVVNYLLIAPIVVVNSQNTKYSYYGSRPDNRRIYYGLNAHSGLAVQIRPTLVCYYKAVSHFRQEHAKFHVSDLDSALDHCTHLIYSSAAIDPETYKVSILRTENNFEPDNYQKVLALRQRYPRLKVLLSIGGGDDNSTVEEHHPKYRELLEVESRRLAFRNSVYAMVQQYKFDGVDLAWQFPEDKPKRIRSTLGSIWHSIKKTVGGKRVIDENAAEHREAFTSLVRTLKNDLGADNLMLSLTVLPNVNSSVYYDVALLHPKLDLINLLAFDWYTPRRNPVEADYTAPLYALMDRKPDANGDGQVRHWLNGGAPRHKLTLGVPTYGWAWRMDGDSDVNGMPPLHVEGAAHATPATQVEGLRSRAEICTMVGDVAASVDAGRRHLLTRVVDASRRKSTFAYRVPDATGAHGVWLGYDETDTIVAAKVGYAKNQGIGVAVYDLTLDDFRAICGAHKYPVLNKVVAQFN